MENWIEKIRKLCDERNIPISQLEEELGFGNGYLNPKKVSDIKVNRLIKILDYIGISIEEFLNVGKPETQAISTALVQLKKASPTMYQEFINAAKYTAEENELIELYRKADDYDKATVKQVLNRYKEDTAASVG